MDGTVTRRSYDEAHLWNPDLRELMRKMRIVENEEFTRAYDGPLVEHRMRVTVAMRNGEQMVGESGGDRDDLSGNMDDDRVSDKFRGICEDFLGAKRVSSVLERLWRLEDISDVAEIPPAFVIG